MSNLLEALEKAFVKLRRKRVSCQLFKKHNGIIQSGPFKGLPLDGKANISEAPLGVKIFGLYEQVVIKKLLELGPFGDVVNFGAADGYFSPGLLKSGQAKRSICFELTQQGRDAISRNAERNGVLDQVVVFGKADHNASKFLQQANFEPKDSLVLCDIEGGEFELFDESFYRSLSGSTIIIELHDRIQTGLPNQRDKIIDCIPDIFCHQIICTPLPHGRGSISGDANVRH